MQAKNVMTTKVVSTPPNASVRSAALKMLANDVSGLPVIDDDGVLVGMLTEGDLLRRVAGTAFSGGQDRKEHSDPQNLDAYIHSNGWSVQEAMCADVITVTPETDVKDIAAIMLSRRVKRVPVVHHGAVIGIVSRCDLLGIIIDAPSDIVASGDEAIRLALATRLKNDLDIDPERIELKVSNTQVFVSGRLETNLQRKAIRSLVESVRGIGGFIDETTLPD
jgi:CBS domain-containing protein